MKKGTRKGLRRASRLNGESRQPTRKRVRVPVPPQNVNMWSRKQKTLGGSPVPVEPKVPESPGQSSTTSSLLGSVVGDAASEDSLVVDIAGEVEQALQKVEYEPAREALAKAWKTETLCATAPVFRHAPRL